MSFILMAKAIQADIPDCYAKWIMVILADHANEQTHECWPSLDRIAQRASINKATVARKLNWLEENGWIVRDRGNSKRSTLYTIFPTVAECDSTVAECDTKLSITSKSNNRRQRVPDDWQPDTDLCVSIDETLKENIDHEHEAARFCDHHQSKGTLFADIRRGYRLWCRNSIKYRNEAASRSAAARGRRPSGGGQETSMFAGIHQQLKGH